MSFLGKVLAASLAVALTGPALASEIGDNGLHIQPFFSDTFMELSDDLAEAHAQGKDLMVIIEQRGCPYCREMHEVNFARDDIPAYISEHFMVVQIDMWGSREVTDFDGKAMEERKLVRRWGVNFTPTTMFFTLDDPAAPPASMSDARAFMMPGYFKPFHHLSAMEYVASDGYRTEPNFQRWLQAKADRMREAGEDVKIWD